MYLARRTQRPRMPAALSGTHCRSSTTSAFQCVTAFRGDGHLSRAATSPAYTYFSCVINGLSKPGDYNDEEALFAALEAPLGGTPCARYYYLRWYSELTKALGGPLGASAGRPAPAINMTVMRERPSDKFTTTWTR